MNSNEFTVTSRFPHEFNHEDVFEVTIKSGNGVEIKTRAYLIGIRSHESFYGRSFNYTFQVDGRIDEQE